jgi:hypothetical protein
MSAALEFLNRLWARYVLRPSLRHPIRAALLAGLVLPLAYPPFYVLPIFYLSTGLAFYLALGLAQALTAPALSPSARRKGLARVALLGWAFGFGQFASGTAWIGEAFLVEADMFLWALPFALTGLPAGLGLFHAAGLCGFWRAGGAVSPIRAGGVLPFGRAGRAGGICARPCADRPAVEFAAYGLGRMALFGAACGAYRHLWSVAFGAPQRRPDKRRIAGYRQA